MGIFDDYGRHRHPHYTIADDICLKAQMLLIELAAHLDDLSKWDDHDCELCLA